jgi:hypothetical protein
MKKDLHHHSGAIDRHQAMDHASGGAGRYCPRAEPDHDGLPRDRTVNMGSHIDV